MFQAPTRGFGGLDLVWALRVQVSGEEDLK